MCGCDIHLYIEYTDKETLKKEKNGDLNGRNEPIKAYWNNFGGKINPGRNYYVFGILSKGVRSDLDYAFEPKGIPDFHSLGYITRGDYSTYITDKEDDEGRYTTLNQAIEWASGEYRSSNLYYRNPTDDKPSWVSGPDWHSASWLTTEEYVRAIKSYKDICKKLHQEEPEYNSIEDAILPEYEAIIVAIKSLESNGKVCRIVFWFDN
jgi:hypothetical protein